MKITLVNPPSPFLINDRVFPYLGILHVATALKDMKDIDLTLLDLAGESDLEKKVSPHLDSDVIGISATSAQFSYAYRLNDFIKKNSKAKTMIGGPHANCIAPERHTTENTSDNIKDLEEFDYIVLGEAENNPDKLVEHIRRGITNKYIDLGLVNIINTKNPDRSLINLYSYNFQIDNKRATTILTQRGCPFRCDFCSGRETEMYGKTRQRTPEQVVAEMDDIHSKYGIRAFQWFDDEVNINPARLKKIGELLKNRDYIHRGFIRTDLMLRHPESLDYLQDIGFVELCAGIESGSDRILELVGKNSTYESNAKVARMIMDRGLKFKAFAMVGHPSETQEDLELTYKWMKEVKPTSHDAAIMTPYPGSKLYDRASPSKKFKDYDWEYKGLYFNKPRFSIMTPFHKGAPGKYFSFVRTDTLTGKDILRARERLEAIK